MLIVKHFDYSLNKQYWLDKKLYIQSAYEIPTEEKENSETASLKLTGDFFQKIVIQRDIVGQYTDESGIIHCNIIDFLLDDGILF